MYQQRACPARCWRLEHIAGPPQQRFFLGSTSNKIGLVMLDPSDGAAWCLAVLKWPHLIKEQARGSNCVRDQSNFLADAPQELNLCCGIDPATCFPFHAVRGSSPGPATCSRRRRLARHGIPWHMPLAKHHMRLVHVPHTKPPLPPVGLEPTATGIS